MSKRYKGKTCVYCGVPNSSNSGDHVLARGFSLKRHRAGIPQVPACKSCNTKKSQLEQYLMVVMSFGAQHAWAKENLCKTVSKRLYRNAQLRKSIERTIAPSWLPSATGLLLRTSTVLVDSAKLDSWIAMLVQGLIWHHWEVVAHPSHDEIEILHLHQNSAAYLSRLLKMRGEAVAETTIGGGALTYQAQGAFNQLPTSVWRFTFYGGVELGGEDPRIRTNEAYVTVTPKQRVQPIA
jgi:hypothetical protein